MSGGTYLCLGCGAALGDRGVPHVVQCPGAPPPPIDMIFCGACWVRLPAVTRARLILADTRRRDRLFQVMSAMRRQVPLERVEVSA